MTPGEASAIDREVAERVMGMTVESGVMHYDGHELPWTVFRRDGQTFNPIPYSTDIARAWEVVERMRSATDDHVFVVLDYGDEVYAGRLHYRQPIEVDELTRAKTAPLAICLAAVKAKA